MKYTYNTDEVPVLLSHAFLFYCTNPTHEATNAMHAIAQPALHLKVCLASHEEHV